MFYYKKIVLLVFLGICSSNKAMQDFSNPIAVDTASGLPKLRNSTQKLQNACFFNAPIQALHASPKFNTFIKYLSIKSNDYPLADAYQTISEDFNNLQEEYFVTISKLVSTKVDLSMIDTLLIAYFNNLSDNQKKDLTNIIKSVLQDKNAKNIDQKTNLLLEKIEQSELKTININDVIIILQQIYQDNSLGNSWSDFTIKLLGELQKIRPVTFNQLLGITQKTNTTKINNQDATHIVRPYLEIFIPQEKQNLETLINQQYNYAMYPNILLIKTNNPSNTKYLIGEQQNKPTNFPTVQDVNFTLGTARYQLKSAVWAVSGHYFALVFNNKGYWQCNDNDGEAITSLSKEEFLRKVGESELIIYEKTEDISNKVINKPVLSPGVIIAPLPVNTIIKKNTLQPIVTGEQPQVSSSLEHSQNQPIQPEKSHQDNLPPIISSTSKPDNFIAKLQDFENYLNRLTTIIKNN